MIKGFKKLVLGFSLLTASCGQAKEKTEERKTEMKATQAKIAAGIKNMDERLKACNSSIPEISGLKNFFSVEEMTKIWVNPIKEFADSESINDFDYEEYGIIKKAILDNMEDTYKMLEKGNC